MFNKCLLGFLVLLLAACSSINVTKKAGGASDLSGYATYRWNLPPFSNPEKVSERMVQLDNSMRHAVAEQMSQRGFSEVNADADLVFDYRLAYSAEYFSETPPVDYQDYGWIWTRDDSGKVERHQNKPNVDPNARVPKAELSLTAFSGDKSKILWSVKADKLVENQGDLQQLNQQVHKSVAKMYTLFPMSQK
jgi:hypothetical protein